jgi:gamma-butyrobetaine dioxygenase
LDGGAVVRLSWIDGTTARFHAIWLRDNAPDPMTRDPRNGQRLITILDIPGDIRVADARVVDGSLQLRFAPDGHACGFPAAWLHARRYDVEMRHHRGVPGADVETWDAHLAAAPPRVTWHAARHDPLAFKAWLGGVRRYGFAIMTGAPAVPGTVAEVAELFGFVRETNYGRIFDVRAEVNPTNLAFTGLALQVHTDNPYRDPVPTLQLLHCLASDAEGGASTVVDGFRAVEILRAEAPDAFELLAGHSVPFEYRGSGGVHLRAEAPLIRLSPEGELRGVRFNNRSAAPFRLAYGVTGAYYKAYRHFAEILGRPALELSFKLGPGDLFVVDNERVLHGRQGYSGAGKRHLQGCYADRDGLLSTLAVLEGATGSEAA